MLDIKKKRYTKPEVGEYVMDGEISLILMSWIDPDNPPGGGDTPGGASTSAAQASTFEENPFTETNLQ